MLATLIPLFDDKMTVKAYSLFSQKTNMLLNPALLGTGANDGAGSISGLEVIESMGMDTISRDKEIFVSVNNISIFTDIDEQCKGVPHERLVILMDKSVKPTEMYVNRLKELKSAKYRLAIRKLQVQEFEEYKNILLLVDYVLLDNKKIDIVKGKIYFSKVYPNVKLIAGNVETQEIYDALVEDGGYSLYEGAFYRLPVTKGMTEVAPLKINYIELLNIVNDADFDLTKAADIIGRDTALVVKLLEIVNKLSVNSEIKDIRHAAAMLGQKELKKWINTAVTNQLCADRPNELTRVSLLRAKYAENLAACFDRAGLASEYFLMGLFSVIDIILDMPMKEALKKVKVSKQIENALVDGKGEFYDILDFVKKYENANWSEIDRLMLLSNLDSDAVYDAYCSSLTWYRDLFRS
ncbi:MAG: HDOD domain-containing protein [Lachnospiraceae bacterium]|nr:HDOD domain-containing protein [Lachnospiraceae bacterium]